MILASGLSFLGLGVRPPEPEWGLMLNTLRTAIYTQPWVAALPGLMIFITSISFNILADRPARGDGDQGVNDATFCQY
nr:dipeptide transport system permease DppC [Raoultella sp. NCTC 9187]